MLHMVDSKNIFTIGVSLTNYFVCLQQRYPETINSFFKDAALKKNFFFLVNQEINEY